MILPPKRYDDPGDPKWDSLRHHVWFDKLSERRDKNSLLYQAHLCCSLGEFAKRACADKWGVNRRELQDFSDFLNKRSRFSEIEDNQTKRQFQGVLDQAFDMYRDTFGAKSFRSLIEDAALLFGVNGRHVAELWDIDPMWYPTQYKKE